MPTERPVLFVSSRRIGCSVPKWRHEHPPPFRKPSHPAGCYQAEAKKRADKNSRNQQFYKEVLGILVRAYYVNEKKVRGAYGSWNVYSLSPKARMELFGGYNDSSSPTTTTKEMILPVPQAKSQSEAEARPKLRN